MKNIAKWLSLASYGLRRKLRIAFCLISILPTLISSYIIFVYLPPKIGLELNISLFAAIGVFISLAGFIIMSEMVEPIVGISSRAKKIAQGDMDYKVAVKRHDEIGDLENALSHLTLRIKDDMKALERYGEQTKEINLEINRKVVALSGLLQISEFISEGINIEEVFDLSAEKMLQIGESDLAFICLRDPEGRYLVVASAAGTGAAQLLNKRYSLAEDSLFVRVMKSAKSFSLDSATIRTPLIDKFKAELGVENAFIVPLLAHNKIMGVAGIANSRGFAYKNDALNLIDIYIKQIVIAIENSALTKKVSHLEIKDNLTGLYNESFIRTRLEEEIKRAVTYQRPCAFIIFRINDYDALCDRFSNEVIEDIFKRVAVVLKENISDVDRAARLSDPEFAVVLPEKNKRNAKLIAEEIKHKIDHLFKDDASGGRKITVGIGVSENPIDGVTALDLIDKAREAITK